MSRDALIVGINQYQHLPPLKSPAHDAEAVAQRLSEAGEFRIKRLPERIEQASQNHPVVSSTQSVSQIQLKQALKQLFLPDSQQAPETALFYFSGHGISDEEGYDKGYLATSDADPNNPSSAISLRWLQWLLSESPVKQQIIWLDCCHSGSLIVNVSAANPGHGQSRDRCFIASSRDFENSWEDLNSPYSVLTKALLEGLDPNRLPGRWIDTFALVDYVNQSLKGELQTPVCTNFGEAINLTKTWQVESSAPAATATDSGHCPYKGLEFFDYQGDDPKYFYGRDQLVGELLDHVRTQNFLALVGASGNGKSSVLRAGLLHQLQQGRRIAGSEKWQILITRPDANPMENLAQVFVPSDGSQLDRAEAIGRATGLLKEGAAGLQRLVQASSAPRTLLVIDQFEEVFTRCDDAEERSHFFECLMGALSESHEKFCLIIAMRADFVGKCLEQSYSGLSQYLTTHTINVLPLEEQELKAAICQPAEQENLVVEPALVTEILNDIKDAPGSLPLLQYTLKELWQRRQDGKLLLSSYQALGGINGTLDQRATEIYNSFDAAQQRTVQHIFQQLTQLGEGTEDTRRRVFLDNLISEPLHPASQVNAVISTLSSPDNRLLVTSEVVSKGSTIEEEKQKVSTPLPARRAIVDVAHEALIRHWRLLRQWIEKNRDLLRQQRRIEASTVTWQERQQSKGYLLQGVPLIEAKQFQKERAETFPLSDAAKAFIEKSVWQQRWNLLKMASWLIVPALLIVGLVEYNIRENSIKADKGRLDSESPYEEKQAVQDLVAGCSEHQKYSIVPKYMVERLWGNCEPLERAPLANADLSSADLRSADLRSATLSSADLSSANLSNAYLRAAILSDAALRAANLSAANLRSADLSSATLSDADLSAANLRAADLSAANLRSADLRSATLSDADLRSADLRSADLRAADLSAAILRDAELSSADLRSATLSSADLSLATLSSADLRSATLSSADLSSATLHDANLLSADLRDADLRSANLRHVNLSNATLHDANLRAATLSSADLSLANLRAANLRAANLHAANLRAANLHAANLSSANLHAANLRAATLSSADLRSADLRDAALGSANLFLADLRSANLRSANLSSANLRSATLFLADLFLADLSSANLSTAILLATDLRDTRNLTTAQLNAEPAPLICNSPLPKDIKIEGGKDRDCDQLAEVVLKRYPEEFENREAAEAVVMVARTKKWD